MIETQVKISPRHLSPALLGVLLASSTGELLTDLKFQQFPPSAHKLVKYSSNSLSKWSWLLVFFTLFHGQHYLCWFVLTVNLTEIRTAMETKLWEFQWEKDSCTTASIFLLSDSRCNGTSCLMDGLAAVTSMPCKLWTEEDPSDIECLMLGVFTSEINNLIQC